MSTYYEVALRPPHSGRTLAQTRLGWSARKSLRGLRSVVLSADVIRAIARAMGRPPGGVRIERTGTKPAPHMILAPGLTGGAEWWVGFTGNTERRARKNPGELLVFGANPGGKVLGKLHQIRYEHETEGLREHDFNGDETIELLRDGSVRIYSPGGERLWDNR